MKEFKSIKEWATEDRPREKMLEKGAEALSNAELLAILINTGTPNRSALDIAKDILEQAHYNLLELSKFSLKDLQRTKGMGSAKAVTLTAALELGKRRQISGALEKPIMKNSLNIFNHFAPYFLEAKSEQFMVMYLNQSLRLIAIDTLSSGGLTSTIVDIRLIMKRALELGSVTKIALAHNHPSGSLIPSDADQRITTQIKEAGKIMEIHLIDHLIIANNQYYSFADADKL